MSKSKKLAKGENKGLRISKVLTKKYSQTTLRLINETITALITTPSKREASKVLKISETALYNRCRRYEEIENGVKAFIDSVKDDARRRIDLSSPIAADKMVSLLEASSENVQLQASTEILDRAGITKPQQTNIQVNVLNDLKKLKDSYN
jgi:hypothetical protein